MAAYASLLSLSKVIDLTISQNRAYIGLICSKSRMMSVRVKVVRLQELLEDLSANSSHSSINAFESRITDVAYRMEDIIEDESHGTMSSLCGKLANLCLQLFPVEMSTSSAFGRCDREIIILLEEATVMKEHYNLQHKDTYTSGTQRPFTTTTSSTEMPTAQLDLKEVPVEMMDWIFGRRRNLDIIPITGMGGIGKTTLARAVYQHPKTEHHFDIYSWVTVSQEFNVKEILRRLLPSDQQNTPDERLIEFVHKRLIGRRYLIVLDDMWDEKAWDLIRNAFPDDCKSSRIILTTRLLDVAARVGSSDHSHQVQFMNEEKSWDLFQDVVGGYELWPKELKDHGRIISTNCRGLPLAVVTTAGLLKFNMTEGYWRSVARDTKSAETAANYDDHLLAILSLSYTNLPLYLKPCFLYFGLFKEDAEIPTEELVRLWTAEGFLKPRGSNEMEEVAEEYLEELVARSLVLVKKKRLDGRIETCSIHDVLRDLSSRKAREEKFSHSSDRMCGLDDIVPAGDDLRRVSLNYMFSSNERILSSYTNVRSLLCYSYWGDDELSFIPNFRLVRVLSAVPISENPQLSILYELTKLRYLHINLSSFGKNPLPPTVGESISKLQNLETLIVSGSWYPDVHAYELILPSEIWEMQRLRHLILVEGSKLPCPKPSHISCAGLEALQTLTGATNFDLTRSIAAKLPNLKKLKLHYNEYLVNAETLFRLDNLVHLHQLEELTVASDFMEVSELSFPQKLKILSLEWTNMPMEKMSLIGSLPNLEVLKLKACAIKGHEWEPIEGEFVQLKYLKMERLYFLYDWRAEREHFPKLETLIIKECEKLKEVPAGIGEIDTLQKLVLDDCSESAVESVEEIKAEQESLCNDQLQVIIIR